MLRIVLIFGLTFTLPKKQSNEAPPQLEITSVRTHTEEPPVKADFLANASQQGGGDTEENKQAKTPLPGKADKQQPEELRICAAKRSE